MPLVKICGMTRPQDAEDAFSLGADFLGLVFAKSRRNVDLRQAQAIMDAVPTFQNFVGVFQNQRLDEVQSIADRLGLTYVQLHGEESAAFCKELSAGGFLVIKAIHIDGNTGVMDEVLNPFEVFAFIFDTKLDNRSGGMGTPFDRNLVEPSVWKNHRAFLSGGLSPENVGAAIETTHPYAVDVSSGVESGPGIKDFRLVREFIQRSKRVLP
ncbi:MAG: phosphoribosylanthranilate isomerase [Candidatus Omnitrophica bacterium]|nr:phosphoribosylanthranilate isomerase [Candidatus Omnitrophota bacterium]